MSYAHLLRDDLACVRLTSRKLKGVFSVDRRQAHHNRWFSIYSLLCYTDRDRLWSSSHHRLPDVQERRRYFKMHAAERGSRENLPVQSPPELRLWNRVDRGQDRATLHWQTGCRGRCSLSRWPSSRHDLVRQLHHGAAFAADHPAKSDSVSVSLRTPALPELSSSTVAIVSAAPSRHLYGTHVGAHTVKSSLKAAGIMLSPIRERHACA